MQGDIEAVEALLEWGYNVNARDNNHLLPLSYAAWKGRVDVVRLLLTHGGDPSLFDDFGVCPLHKAAAFGHVLVMAQLLRSGKVGVNIRTGEVRAPAHYEAKSLRQTALQLSLRPNINVTQTQRLECVELLLGFGGDPNVCDVHGETSAHYAARLGDGQVLWHVLVQGQANVKIRNDKGQTPIECLPWSKLYLAPLFWVASLGGR